MFFLSINRVRGDADHTQFGAAVPAHVEWLRDLIGRRIVRQAGRWGDEGGMVIIEVRDQAEAEAIQCQDPLVAAGLVNYELAPFLPDVEFR